MSERCGWKNGMFFGCCESITMTEKGLDVWGDSGDWEILKKASFCPFCGADIRKPVEIKSGMLVKAKNSDTWSVVKEVRTDYVVLANGFTSNLKMITPGLPKGFNMDGTPKEETDEKN